MFQSYASVYACPFMGPVFTGHKCYFAFAYANVNITISFRVAKKIAGSNS